MVTLLGPQCRGPAALVFGIVRVGTEADNTQLAVFNECGRLRLNRAGRHDQEPRDDTERQESHWVILLGEAVG